LKRKHRFQVGGSVEIDDTDQPQRVVDVQLTGLRQLRPRGQPHGEMPAGRVADRDHARQIQLMVALERPQEIRGLGDVLKRARPSAPVVSQASILDVPGGNTRFRQCRGKGAHVVHRDGAGVQISQLRDPAATMDDDRHRVRAFDRRQSQLANLHRIVSISDSSRFTRNLGRRQVEGIPALRRNGAGQQRDGEE
jgi:hypothetical protein